LRKVIFQMMISIDGFFEGIDQDISWHNVDDEFNKFAADLLDEVDALLFGRITYQLMASYWPGASDDDPKVAERMNNLPKIVFSRTLENAVWNNTRLIRENIEKVIRELKQESGKDMVILGSSNLALTFIEFGLIDEFRIIVNPVVLGKGRSLFTGINKRLNLKLIRTKTFDSGNVLFYYQPLYNEVFS
jgi:dihydrofolate reductase